MSTFHETDKRAAVEGVRNKLPLQIISEAIVIGKYYINLLILNDRRSTLFRLENLALHFPFGYHLSG